jgi:hypothetical protein
MSDSFFLMHLRIYFILTILFLAVFNSCSEKEQLIDLEQDIFLGVGKWKIKKKAGVSSSKKSECDVTDLILNSDFTFKIYTADNGILLGSYQVISDENISLANNQGLKLGELTNIQVSGSEISFTLNLEGNCQNDLEGNKDETYEENKTYIADLEFEKLLIEEGLDDVVDNFVLTSSIARVGYLNASDRNINALVGIEEFKNLEGISAARNQISGVLDLSYNTKLVNIDLPFNPITELYLNNNPALENLWIYATYTLEKLEISNSPNLYSLTTHNNRIESYDLKNSPNIFNLRIWDGQLKELDLSHLSKLEYLVAWNVLNDSNGGEIILPINSSLKVLGLGSNRLQQIVNLSTSVKLERADLSNNQLTGINFSNNPKVQYLAIEGNQLNELDVSPLENLLWLRATGNQISCVTLSEAQINAIPPSCSDLGLPNNTDQEEEFCYDNAAWIEEDFFPRNYEISSSWVVDEGTTYSTNCN